MNFQEIYNLTEFIPRNSRYFGSYRTPDSSNRSFEVSRFSICYSDLAFLWHFVKSYTDAGLDIPNERSDFTDHPAYELIDRVVAFETSDENDEELAHAISLDRGVPLVYKNVIQACLLADDANISYISSLTGIPESVLELYEKLFFDVGDRKNDTFLIAGIVYPESRMVEVDPNYITTVSYDALLKRIARMGGVADVLSFAGVTGMTPNGQTQALAASFENKLFANADFMARIGALNSKNSAGINNAKNLLAAAKHGGETDTQSIDMLSTISMGASILQEMTEGENHVLEERRVYQAEIEEEKEE